MHPRGECFAKQVQQETELGPFQAADFGETNRLTRRKSPLGRRNLFRLRFGLALELFLITRKIDNGLRRPRPMMLAGCAQPRRDRSSRLCLALERDSLWE